MGTTLRWRTRCEPSPGVGDYDLTGFKRLDKASETRFFHQKLTADSPGKLGGPSKVVTNSLNSVSRQARSKMFIPECQTRQSLGPGPAAYDPDATGNVWKKPRVSFPKEDRGIVKYGPKPKVKLELETTQSTAN